jgi:hypothetical protein
LIKRTTIVARLFYHTAMCLLTRINPILPISSPEMHELQTSHSHDLCGIVAHVKDRGVASVAIRSLAIAAEGLVSRREQDEVLTIFDKIRKETGWRVAFLHKELKEKWGWHNEEEAFQQQQQQQQQNQQMQAGLMQMPGFGFQPQSNASGSSLPPAPPTMMAKGPPQGIVNPLLSKADFSAPKHPYQNYWVPPQSSQYNQY